MDDDLTSTGSARIFPAVLRLFIIAAAFVGLLVADGALFWVFLVILTAAVVSALPVASPARQRADKGLASPPRPLLPPPGAAVPTVQSGDRGILLEVVGPVT